MKVVISTRHNFGGLAATDNPVQAQKLRPAAMAAVGLFHEDWLDREVTAPVEGRLMLSIELDHAGTLDETGAPVLGAIPGGMQARLRLYRPELMDGTEERLPSEIHTSLEAAMAEVLVRLGALGRPADG